MRRFRGETGFVADAIWDELSGIGSPCTLVDPLDMTRRKTLPADAAFEDLLRPVFRGGVFVGDTPALAAVRQRAQDQLAALHAGVKRFANPHQHPVGLEAGLHERKTRLILEGREASAREDHVRTP